MNSLVIGKTAQLSYYFPDSYDRIFSRDIDFESIKDRYDRIFLLFAEQRTFLSNDLEFFTNVNVDYTLDVINKLKDYCNDLVIYSTSELWNNCEGEVSVDLPFNYNHTNYIKSKEILSNKILDNKQKYKNVHIVYPFNFNSPYRKKGFLFYKIFDALINKNNVEVGNLNFNRDLIHPRKIVEHSISTKEDMLIGTGELINIEKFIIDLFEKSNLDYKDYISYQSVNALDNIRKEYYSKIKYSNYQELLELTHDDTK